MENDDKLFFTEQKHFKVEQRRKRTAMSKNKDIIYKAADKDCGLDLIE